MKRSPILAAGLAAACLALEGSACIEHAASAARAIQAQPQAKAQPQSKTLAPLWVGPAFSGSWYTASRNGEGFTLQVLANGTALVVWFTYPPAGSTAQQAWILAQDGVVEGDRIRFNNAITTRGPRFGAGFDPAQVQLLPWGTLEFRFTGCNSGELGYAGPAAWGSGTRAITRLAQVSELECSGKRKLTETGTRSLAGLKQRSGSWFDPAHNGEGWQLEELPDGRNQIYWFTYDDRGEQAWTIGVSPAGGESFEVPRNLRPVGTNFGNAFNPASVRLEEWGRLQFNFTGCDTATMNYTSTLPGFGSGSLSPIRLSQLAGISCLGAEPVLPTAGTWSQGALMPEPQSEFALATIGTRSCAVGGFGGFRSVKCYDLATDAWTSLPDLPGDRDHGMAIPIGGDFLALGGYRGGGGQPDAVPANAWRYKSAEARWEAVPGAPNAEASGAAILDGFGYFGDITGELRQVNLRTMASRTIPAHRPARDHSQVVAFQGEIWMIAGRDGIGANLDTVSIYDPASETWRAGPVLGGARSGFAAAASASMIIVAGGESLGNPRRVIGEAEGIAAGASAWQSMPRLPIAQHGFGGAIIGNAFVTLSGSRAPGIARNEGQVQIYRW